MLFSLNITANTLEELSEKVSSNLVNFKMLAALFENPATSAEPAKSKTGEIDGGTFDEGLDESEFDVVEETVVDETPKLDKKRINALMKRLNEVCGRDAVSNILNACKVKLTADIPERHYDKVFEKCNEYITKKLAAKAKEAEKSEIPASELFDTEEEPTNVPELQVMKDIAKAMNKLSPLDYKKLVKEFSITSARSFVTLSDDSKISLFAKMNDFVGKNTPA